MTAQKFARRAEKFTVSSKRVGTDASVRQLDCILRGMRNPLVKGTKLEALLLDAIDAPMTFEDADQWIKRIAAVVAKRQNTPKAAPKAAEQVSAPVCANDAVIAEMVRSGKLGKVAQRRALELTA